MLRFVSAFAGIEGFGLAFTRAGMERAGAIEIDKAAQSVIRRHFPDVPLYGDIKEVTGREFGHVDLICGGFPCQDVSVAGRRAGLAGERTGLYFEAVRLIAEIRPSWIVLENVPGLLSSNDGRDMGTVLTTLVELGYGVAYRVLDAQYFGVAQRRRRVFIVGHLGDSAGAFAVLFEPEGLRGDSPARRQAGTDIAATLRAGANTTGGTRPPGTDVDTAETLQVVSTLQGGGKRGYRVDAEGGRGATHPNYRRSQP